MRRRIIDECYMVDETETIKVGRDAPDFQLVSNESKVIRLSDYQGKQHVVLYFMSEFN